MIVRAILPDPIARCEAALEALIATEQRAHRGLSREAAVRAVIEDGRGLAVIAVLNAFRCYRDSLLGLVPIGREDATARRDMTRILGAERVDVVAEAIGIALGRKPVPMPPKARKRLYGSGYEIEPSPIENWYGYLALKRTERGLLARRSAMMQDELRVAQAKWNRFVGARETAALERV